MEALGIDAKLLLAQLINFGIFAYVCIKYLLKPFREFMDSEHQLATKLSKLEKELQNEREQSDEMLAKATLMANQKADEIIKSADATAQRLKLEVQKEAKDEASKILSDAKHSLALEKAQLMSELSTHLKETSLQMTKATLVDILGPSEQKQILDNAISNLNKIKIPQN